MPVWWNWQTPGIQNPVSARTCGFDPRHRHQNKDSSSYWNPLIFPYIARKNRLKNVIAYLSKFKQIIIVFSEIMPWIMTRSYTLRTSHFLRIKESELEHPFE